MRRIGEILLEHGWVSRELLDRALVQQRESGMRTCSYLIACGAIDSDTASRALGEQHGVAAALERHLEHRDQSLAALLPAASAQLYTALPLGRMSSGEVLVCCRDPRPELRGVLARTMKERVVLAVAPATRLDALVRETYGEDANEFEVDMGTQPIPIALELDDPTFKNAGIPEMDNFQLVELDDKRVSKDPTQSGHLVLPGGDSQGVAMPRTSTLPPRQPVARTTTPPPSIARTSTLPPRQPAPPPPLPLTAPLPAVARTASQLAIAIPRTATPTALASGTVRPTREFVPLTITLADTLSTLGTARTNDDILDAAMRFIAGRWRAALLLSVEGHDAIGVRGHGPKLTSDVVRSLSISLAGPSLLRSARKAGGKLVTQLPAGGDEVHDQLELFLAVPKFPAAVGVIVGSVVEYVLAIGDPNASDVEAATGDLSRIATALSAAFTRLERR